MFIGSIFKGDFSRAICMLLLLLESKWLYIRYQVQRDFRTINWDVRDKRKGVTLSSRCREGPLPPRALNHAVLLQILTTVMCVIALG